MILKVIGWILIAISISGIIYLRILGIDDTEGRLLLNYWPEWCAVIVSMFTGIYALIAAGEI